MNKEFFKKNRKRLFALMDEPSLALFWATVTNNGKMAKEFRQDMNFYYLTGIKAPNAILALLKKKDKTYSYLFIEREIPELVVWLGNKLSKKEAKKISGIEKIYYIDEFERILHQLTKIIETTYIDYYPSSISSIPSYVLWQTNRFKEHYPGIPIQRAANLMKELRWVKNKKEITSINKAIEITNKAIKNLIKHTKPDKMEYELEAYFRFSCIKNGEKQLAFPPIIASGINSTILHYEQNNSKVNNGDVILIDVGAKFKEYNADISRTFPANGKFTKRQKEVYQEVLHIQKKIIDSVKPGITIRKLQNKTIVLMKKALYKLNLINDSEDKNNEYRKFYMHGVSHPLGLDPHDYSDIDKKLNPGSVITVEPGIYIKKEKLGIRIEDDILVTKDGHENLSRNIPKEINEYEELFSQKHL